MKAAGCRAAKSVILLIGVQSGGHDCSSEQKARIASVFDSHFLTTMYPMIRTTVAMSEKLRKGRHFSFSYFFATKLKHQDSDIDPLVRTIHQTVTSQPYMPAFISRGAVLFEEWLATER